MHRALLAALVCALGACDRAEHSATAPLTDTANVTLTARGLFSLQPDWERRLIIHTSTEELTVDLLSDTGWWRGSNLYLTDTGLMVLDEGQGAVWPYPSARCMKPVQAASASCCLCRHRRRTPHR